MSKRSPNTKSAEAVSLDLQAFGAALTQVLAGLLLSRDWDALVRWSKARSWVDNALAGDPAPDLQTIELAIAYLVERASDMDRGTGV